MIAGAAAAEETDAVPSMPSVITRDDSVCTLTPKHIEGPYYVFENMQRSDIRSDTSDGSLKSGVPLAIKLRVFGSSAGRCSPLADAVVDVWHCDATGIYSDAIDPKYNTVGKTFLRGYQVTDTHGEVQFKTIFPGRYAVRATHIHVKVRQKRGYAPRDLAETMRIVEAAGMSPPSGAKSEKPLIRQEFTTQLYIDDAITDTVYEQPPYAGHVQNQITNKNDIFFKEGSGPRLILPLARVDDGYAGTYKLAIQLD
jgi:protocatechuate 3,4-dioxygenase beta subunit